MLENNQTLTDLYIGQNNIGDNDIKYLSEALQNNQNLKALYLNSNNIGDNGVKFLSEAVAAHISFISIFHSFLPTTRLHSFLLIS